MSLIQGEITVHRVTKITITGARDIGATEPTFSRSIVITNIDEVGKEHEVEVSLFADDEDGLRLVI